MLYHFVEWSQSSLPSAAILHHYKLKIETRPHTVAVLRQAVPCENEGPNQRWDIPLNPNYRE